MSCSPVIALAVGIVAITLVLGSYVRPRVVSAEAAITHYLMIAAATACTAVACALLAAAARTVAAATGRHTEVIPAPELAAEHVTVPFTPPAGTVPVTVPFPVPGSYTWRIPPERTPGKSDVVSDMAAMAADADALETGTLDPTAAWYGS